MTILNHDCIFKCLFLCSSGAFTSFLYLCTLATPVTTHRIIFSALWLFAHLLSEASESLWISVSMIRLVVWVFKHDKTLNIEDVENIIIYKISNKLQLLTCKIYLTILHCAWNIIFMKIYIFYMLYKHLGFFAFQCSSFQTIHLITLFMHE